MKFKTKLLSFVMALILCLNCFTATAFAASTNTDYYASDIYFSQEDRDFLDKVASVSNYYYIENNAVKISLSKDELMGEYGFSNEEYDRLATEVLVSLSNGSASQRSQNGPRKAHVSNGTLYISHSDLSAGAFAILATAASAGPAAMAAAINALSNMIPAPVGTILGAILTVAAAPSLVELCGRVAYAVATGKGIYIKPVASYPPLEIGYWG